MLAVYENNFLSYSVMLTFYWEVLLKVFSCISLFGTVLKLLSNSYDSETVL